MGIFPKIGKMPIVLQEHDDNHNGNDNRLKSEKHFNHLLSLIQLYKFSLPQIYLTPKPKNKFKKLNYFLGRQ